ncbi:MAG: hypothetical protein M1536_09330 [Firmicutes bacterium]|nr:hypothetical protein [Bacillota bacterium]
MVEVLIALALLSTGILAVIGVYPVILQMNTSSQNNDIALSLAQQKLDEILSNGTFISTSAQSDMPSNLPSCTRQWWGSSVPYNSSLQQIDVQVTWTEKNRLRSVTVTSIISQ